MRIPMLHSPFRRAASMMLATSLIKTCLASSLPTGTADPDTKPIGNIDSFYIRNRPGARVEHDCATLFDYNNPIYHANDLSAASLSKLKDDFEAACEFVKLNADEYGYPIAPLPPHKAITLNCQVEFFSPSFSDAAGAVVQLLDMFSKEQRCNFKRDSHIWECADRSIYRGARLEVCPSSRLYKFKAEYREYNCRYMFMMELAILNNCHYDGKVGGVIRLWYDEINVPPRITRGYQQWSMMHS